MLRWEKWVIKLEKFIIDCNNSTRVESMYKLYLILITTEYTFTKS